MHSFTKNSMPLLLILGFYCLNEVAFCKIINSFINDIIYLFVLQHIKEHTKSYIDNDNPIKLLIDNPNSHISIQVITCAKENCIAL